MDYWQTLVEEERFRDLKKALGVLWERDDIEAMRDRGGGKRRMAPDELFIPLAAIMEPNLLDHVRKSFGSKVGINAPKWVKSSDIVDLYESTDRDQFLDFVGTFIRPKVVGK